MLMNRQFLCRIFKGWVECGLSPFLSFTLNYLSEDPHTDTGLILIVARNLPVTCILVSVCLYG